MAIFEHTFNLTSEGSLTAAGTENWIDILSHNPDINSPIPTGQQVRIGYITCISQDKNASFELRPNTIGNSTGTVGTTNLRGFVSVPSGESRDLDVYYGNAILSLAPVSAVSTGVEKLWIRVKSGSASSATYEFIIYYSLY